LKECLAGVKISLYCNIWWIFACMLAFDSLQNSFFQCWEKTCICSHLHNLIPCYYSYLWRDLWCLIRIARMSFSPFFWTLRIRAVVWSSDVITKRMTISFFEKKVHSIVKGSITFTTFPCLSFKILFLYFFCISCPPRYSL